jgi:integrase/recombinase XerC
MVRVHAGKGGKEREVPLKASARRALALYLKTREDHDSSGSLFLSERGGHAMSMRTVQATVQELARRAKITRIPVSAHTRRHTFALTFLRRNPGKLIELATLLGHESLDTTAVYLRPSVSQEARNLIRQMSRDNPLWGAPRIYGELSSWASTLARPVLPSIWCEAASHRRRVENRPPHLR